MTVPSPFAARALAERARYDAVLARALAHGADRDVLADAVREVAAATDPLATQLGADAFAATCDALVAAVARLAAARRWRAEGPERRAVLDVVPRLAPWLALAPAVTVAAVVDGARAVGGGPGSRGDVTAWAARVVDAAAVGAAGVPGAGPGPSPVDVVRGAVLVAAWRSGLVRYRDAALAAARSLPEPVARAALSLAPGGGGAGAADLGAVLERHAADPWWWPGRVDGDLPTVRLRGVAEPARVLGRFGGFRGFGGPWLSPALVVGADARHPALRWTLLSPAAGGTGADAATDEWTLVADAHGSLVARRPGAGDEVPPTVGAELPGGDGGPAAARDDVTDVSGSAVVDTPSGRVALLSRTGSYDVLLVRWAR